MNNNLQRLSEPMACYSGDYLNTLLHGPNNSSLMAEELKKINAHVIQEEAMMKNVLRYVGVTALLAIVVYLYYVPGII